MKWILLSAFAGALLFTSGCLCSREEWGGHERNARYGGIPAGSPAVVVWAPARAPRSGEIIPR